MLGKLIKYEFKALGRILFPLYGVVLIMGIISSLFMRSLLFDVLDDMVLMNLVMILFFITYIITLFGSGIMCFILSIIRFKKNLLGDEGYLMHTLPVKKSQLVLSKVISATVMQVLGITVAAVSGFCFILNFAEMSFSELQSKLSIIAESLSDFVGFGIITAAELVIIGIISLMGMNLMIYASLSIGYSRNTHKTLGSVCVFIGFYFISRFVSHDCGSVMMKVYEKLLDMDSPMMSQPFSVIQLYILTILLLQILYAAAYFFITSYSLKRKLNI